MLMGKFFTNKNDTELESIFMRIIVDRLTTIFNNAEMLKSPSIHHEN